MSTPPQLANVITGSPHRNHDYDFARRKILDALYEAGDIRTDVFNNYDDGEAIENGDMLVTYTSQVPVANEQCAALRRYLERGGRWLALHSTTSVAGNPILPGILGGKFLSHPPYTNFEVTVSAPDDPLMEGIPPTFAVDDELYIVEPAGDIEVLIETYWGGKAFSGEFPEAVRPLMYRHRVGDGAVLYLALGHCNRRFDVPRIGMPDTEDHRGPWATDLYQELIRRAIDWVAGRRPL